jgi:hypothetical protein
VTSLLRRIAAEKRWWLWPLAALLALDLVGYFVVVRPMAEASSGAGVRATEAAGARRSAEQIFAAAELRQNAQRQALTDLEAFHREMLPGSLAEARRMTYANLPALADQSGVSYRRRRSEVAPADEDSRLMRLTTVVEFAGNYGNLRDFIHQVELAPEFIVIDDMTITEVNPGEPLGLVLTLSTYYPETAGER